MFCCPATGADASGCIKLDRDEALSWIEMKPYLKISEPASLVCMGLGQWNKIPHLYIKTHSWPKRYRSQLYVQLLNYWEKQCYIWAAQKLHVKLHSMYSDITQM